MVGLTVDLLAGDALDVDDPFLPVHLHNLSFPSLHKTAKDISFYSKKSGLAGSFIPMSF